MEVETEFQCRNRGFKEWFSSFVVDAYTRLKAGGEAHTTPAPAFCPVLKLRVWSAQSPERAWSHRAMPIRRSAGKEDCSPSKSYEPHSLPQVSSSQVSGERQSDHPMSEWVKQIR